MTEGQTALQLRTGFVCPDCYDSSWAYTDKRVYRCCVDYSDYAFAQILRQFTNALAMKIVGPRYSVENLDLKAFDCARALVRATALRPVRNTTLGMFLGVNERQVKDTIKTLRDDWKLPIGSLREPPYGYYWISTPEEFLAWFEPMRSQAFSELRTAYRLMRAHYPQLAGQFTFNFDQEDSPNG